MRHPFAVCGVLILGLSTPAAAQSPTCTFPWSATHDVSARYVVGGFYRDPYTHVIEILARVCGAYDRVVDELTGALVSRTCVDERLAVRNVRGAYFLSTGAATPPAARRTVLWFDPVAEKFIDPVAYIPAETPVGAFGRLPDGCYSPSTIVSADGGRVKVVAR